MRKRFDDIFTAIMLAFGVAAILAGMWCLSHSIDRAKADPAPVQVAPVHLDLPAPTPEPTPEA